VVAALNQLGGSSKKEMFIATSNYMSSREAEIVFLKAKLRMLSS